MKRLLRLRLVHAITEETLEEVAVTLDPEYGGDEFTDTLRRHYIAMACRAADEGILERVEDMTWLHDYTLLVSEHDNPNDVLVRYREA